jgi:hypothetical protein
MFYCCAIPECTFYELGAQIGDHIALSKWQFGKAPRLNHIAFTQNAFKALGSRRSCPDFERDEKIAGIRHHLVRPARNALVGAFVAEAFTTKVEHGKNDYHYKLSIALSEVHLSDPSFDGLLYPTIAMSANADNIAFTPQYVDANVRFISADYLLDTSQTPENTQTSVPSHLIIYTHGNV